MTNEEVGLGEDEGERARLIDRYGRHFLAGDAIFRDGDDAHEAFLLEAGRIRILKRIRMVERSLMVLRPGDLFGELALVDEGGARNSSAVALTDGVVLPARSAACYRLRK